MYLILISFMFLVLRILSLRYAAGRLLLCNLCCTLQINYMIMMNLGIDSRGTRGSVSHSWWRHWPPSSHLAKKLARTLVVCVHVHGFNCFGSEKSVASAAISISLDTVGRVLALRRVTHGWFCHKKTVQIICQVNLLRFGFLLLV